MESGQGNTQPFGSDDEAAQAALAILQKDPEFASEKPRDEAGKFKANEVKTETATPETEAAEVKTEEPQTEEEQQTATPEPRKLKLKYKGEELEKDESEVIDLAQKGYDYHRNIQAIQKEREEIATKIKAEIDAKSKHYEDQLEIHKQAVLKLADREALNADLNKLAESDPARAQQLFFKRLEINQALQGIAAEQQRIHAQRNEEQRTNYQKQVREAQETLQSDIPGWGQELYGKVLKTGEEYGFKKEEVNAITDPRAIKVLNDARQWRELKAAKPSTVDKKVASVPKVVKPGTAEKSDPNADKWKQGMDALKKSGGKDDRAAAALAMRILEREGIK